VNESHGRGFFFCNWLSRREGRRPVYDMTPAGVKLKLADGYRLPFGMEWECA